MKFISLFTVMGILTACSPRATLEGPVEQVFCTSDHFGYRYHWGAQPKDYVRPQNELESWDCRPSAKLYQGYVEIAYTVHSTPERRKIEVIPASKLELLVWFDSQSQ